MAGKRIYLSPSAAEETVPNTAFATPVSVYEVHSRAGLPSTLVVIVVFSSS